MDTFLASPHVSNEFADPLGMNLDQGRAVCGFLACYVGLRHLVLPAVSGRLSKCYREDLSAWEKAQWLSRWISLIHCFPACWLASVAILAEPGEYWTDATLIDSNSWLSQRAVANTMAYMIHDVVDLLANYLTHGKSDGGALVWCHHIFGIGCYLHFYSYGKFAVIVCAWILTELSTPFLNMIWFYEKLKMPNARTYSGVLLWVAYLPTRMLLSPLTGVALYDFWPSFQRLPTLCYGQFITMLSFATVMNYFWFYKITKGLIKALKKTFGAAAPDREGGDGKKSR